MNGSIDRVALFASLPPIWPETCLPAIRSALGSEKLVVLDDDPTGTQTVYDVPVLTSWGIDELCAELADPAPALYILTNSRALPEAEAVALTTTIGRNLREAERLSGRRIAVVSRSDSTLRGHFPAEVAALADAMGQSDAPWLLVPCFEDGGRHTINDVHYVAEGDQLVPAGETPFARDATFGYHSSNMREWVAEKTSGAVAANGVASISLKDIRQGGPQVVAARLLALRNRQVCVVNAAVARDLEVVVRGLLEAERRRRRFIPRTAASFVAARIGLEPRPLLSAATMGLPTTGGGLVVVGSYVPKTSGQLQPLLALPDVVGIELSVDGLLGAEREATIATAAAEADRALQRDADAVVYTSRRLITGEDGAASLAIGSSVSAGLVEVVQRITARPRYLIAKGGITSSDTATKALAVKRALVLGQALAGVPVWRLGDESRWPGLAYIVFPGNVGGPNAVADLVAALRSGA